VRPAAETVAGFIGARSALRGVAWSQPRVIMDGAILPFQGVCTTRGYS